MRQTSTVLYIAIDSLIPADAKKIVAGFDDFTAALDHAGVPAVWLTVRSRFQLDEPRRRLGHVHPFIAENGCAVYLPQDYFHLRPVSAASRARKGETLRLGRFTCVPVAERLPAASDALEALSAETGVPVVTLRSLSTRDLVQNTGLPRREAELFRQRDFDELFFFAGVSDEEIKLFLNKGRAHNMELCPQGVFWSAAIGASMRRCLTELSSLYDRALHCHVRSIAVATEDLAPGVFPFCSRSVLLTDREPEGASTERLEAPRVQQIRLRSPEVWELLLESLGLSS